MPSHFNWHGFSIHLSICRVVFPDFTQSTHYRKSLQFHVHRDSRMHEYIPLRSSMHSCAHGSCILRSSLYYSWQLSVLLACSRSPIMQCIHLCTSNVHVSLVPRPSAGGGKAWYTLFARAPKFPDIPVIQTRKVYASATELPECR